MSLKLYYDLMSQPSRALYILMKTANLNFEPVPVALKDGQHYTEEFAKISKFNKVPVIEHNGFALTESVAIVKYLSKEKILSEKYFPTDSKTEAMVNEYLAWQHIGIRAPCALYFLGLVIEPLLKGKPLNEKVIETRYRKMVEALDLFENKWLGSGKKYIVGDTLTVADVFGCCEIEQPRMAGFDPKDGRPNIAAWMQRVKEETSPFYDEAHAIVNKIASKKSKTSKL